MTTQEKLDAIGAYDYGVYSFPGGFAIADPIDDAEGLYLEYGTLEFALDDFIAYLRDYLQVEEGPLAVAA